MDNLIEITLIKEDITLGPCAQEIRTEASRRTIFGHRGSITRAEWAEAGRRDINADFRVDIYGFEYEGETTVEVGAAKYGVYRTYSRPNSDYIELYLERKGGIS